jgi:hypothetical protein
MNPLKRLLAAVGVAVCLLAGYLGLLCLVFGLGGILWFLCTWLFLFPLTFVAGLMILPDVQTRS